jgi:hypothetical protein
MSSECVERERDIYIYRERERELNIVWDEVRERECRLGVGERAKKDGEV